MHKKLCIARIQDLEFVGFEPEVSHLMGAQFGMLGMLTRRKVLYRIAWQE